MSKKEALRNLGSKINSRVEVIVLIPEESEIEEKEQSKAALLQDFRQAWHEAMIGQTIPVAQLWEVINCYAFKLNI